MTHHDATAAAAKLAAAAQIVDEALNLLDRRTRPCSDCGRRVGMNLTHHEAGRSLDNIPDRLRRWAGALTDPDTRNLTEHVDGKSAEETAHP